MTVGRVVVVGAGIVGACCALYAARCGWDVTVIDRAAVASGTSSHGEGNLLVSDKGAGAELDLMLLSRRLWLELGDHLGRDAIELDEKGGLVVAATEPAADGLRAFADGQLAVGIDARDVVPRDLEPRIAPGLTAGFLYPQDLQVQPVLATQCVLADAVRLGAEVRTHTEVLGRRAGSVGDPWLLALSDGATLAADLVVNAAGPWGGQVARLLGGEASVLPRRGFVLVTEPVGPIVRHKVYSADYVDNVGSSDAGLQTSCVIESTRGGTVLIGASRERVGFDGALDPDIVRRLSAQAVALFPVLDEVRLLRTYRGFRPYCPDHLPLIGPDVHVAGLIHACGHEGAGIGLGPATGLLVSAMLATSLSAVADANPPREVEGVFTAPFAPSRFHTEEA